MDSCTIALVILAVAVLLFVTEWVPIPVTAVTAAVMMGLFGVISFSDVFSGFANDITMMVMGAVIVGEALFETGVAQQLGKGIIRLVGMNERVFLIVCLLISGVLSAFLSNTAVVAMMLPLVASTAASSRGQIKKKNIYMAIGFAANVGGGMTLVGSTPNVIGQGLLAGAGLETMGFFDLLWGSIPRFLFMILFYATVGLNLEKKIFDFEEPETEAGPEPSAQTGNGPGVAKMAVAIGILVLMVAGFVTGVWTVGAVAMVAGLACIWTRCISVKQVFQRMDWTTVWVLAGSFGIAAGVDKSGAGRLIANTVIGWFGGSVSMLTLMILFTLLAVVMGNLMSSSASAAVLGPVAIYLCTQLGYPAKPLIMAIIWGLNLAFLTPVATPPVTMTLQGGYRFLDYTKMGSILLAGCLALTLACYPFLI